MRESRKLFAEIESVPISERAPGPPPVDWQQVVEQASDTTKWVVVPDVNKSYAWRIRHSVLVPFREAKWDVAVRVLGGERPGNVTLYIRKAQL